MVCSWKHSTMPCMDEKVCALKRQVARYVQPVESKWKRVNGTVNMWMEVKLCECFSSEGTCKVSPSVSKCITVNTPSHRSTCKHTMRFQFFRKSRPILGLYFRSILYERTGNAIVHVHLTLSSLLALLLLGCDCNCNNNNNNDKHTPSLTLSSLLALLLLEMPGQNPTSRDHDCPEKRQTGRRLIENEQTVYTRPRKH